MVVMVATCRVTNFDIFAINRKSGTNGNGLNEAVAYI